MLNNDKAWNKEYETRYQMLRVVDDDANVNLLVMIVMFDRYILSWIFISFVWATRFLQEFVEKGIFKILKLDYD